MREFFERLAPDLPSGELACMAAVLGILAFAAGLIFGAAAGFYPASIAVGLYLAAHYCWVRGC